MAAKFRNVLHLRRHRRPVKTLINVLSPASKTLALELTASRLTALFALLTLVANLVRIAPRLTAREMDVKLVNVSMLRPLALTKSVAPSPALLALAILLNQAAKEANAVSAKNIPAAKPTLTAHKLPALVENANL